MKQKLLLFAASVMFAISASAQWTKPTVSSFSEMATDGQTVQFIYNVDTQKFLVGANDWGTRASVGEQGDSIMVELLEDGHYGIKAMCTINSNKTTWGYISCEDWNMMWMDRSLNGTESADIGAGLWKIRKEGDIYKFTNDAMFDAYELGDDATWGVAEIFEGSTENTRVFIYDPTQTYTKVVDEEEFPGTPCFAGAFYDKWKFVSLADYEAYNANLSAYLAAESLKAAIDKAEADYPGIDLSAQKAVYNNTASTAEQLKEAEAEVSAAVVDFLKGDATWEDPANFSSSIVNATFDVVGDFTGWKGTGFAAGGTTDACAERWLSSFNTYQDIVGLPEGVYMLQCNGYCYSNADFATDYRQWKEGTPTLTKLYMNAKTYGDFSTPVIHVSQAYSMTAFDTDDRTINVTDEDGVEFPIYGPNTMKAACMYFHDGQNKFLNKTYGAIGAGDTLRIGVSTSTSADWNVFDDFELYYYGDDIHAYQMWGKTVAENNTVEFNTYYGAPEKALYDNAIATLTSATDKQAIIEGVKNMQVVSDSVVTSMNNYKAYVAAINSALESLTNMEESHIEAAEVDLLADYLQASAEDNPDFVDVFPNGVANYILNLEAGEFEGKLSAAAIAEETAYVQALVQSAYEHGMQEGSDVTNLLVNASFKDGFTGWTNSSGGEVVGKVGGLSSFPDVECFQTIVDVQQTVKAQPGVYAFTARCFERPGGNGSFTGDEDPRVFLFMNQFRTPVQNICKDAIPEEEAIDQVNCYLGDQSGAWPYDYMTDYGWIPNSVDGASYAFLGGRYEQSCYGLVGEDGVMTIGLTSDNVVIEWVLWADFHITFMGKNAEALASIIDYYVEQSQLVYGAGTPDQNALDKAVEDAEAAEETGDGDAMYDALFDLIEAYNKALESQKLYEKSETLLIDLENTMGDYATVASQEAMDNAQDILDNEANNIYERAYSAEELAEVNKKLEKAIAKLKLPDYSTPPTDFTDVIQNPNMDTGNSEPWIITVGYENGGYQGASYTNTTEGNEWNGTTISQFVETWRPGAILGDGYIYQVLQALPAGQYKLECDAISSWQNNAATEVTGVELIMAEAASGAEVNSYSGTAMYTGNGQPEHFEVIFDKTGDDNTPLLIGIRVNGTNANWVAADNFTLTYLGESGIKKGDVNEDGAVNINDVVAIINVMAGTASWPNANVNGDEKVDINDVVAVINIMAGQ